MRVENQFLARADVAKHQPDDREIRRAETIRRLVAAGFKANTRTRAA
jgi:hypothetical protein